ncbi:hypothetical protein ACLMJK_002228 [Lecanora helva]
MTIPRRILLPTCLYLILSFATASPLAARASSNAATVGLHWAPNGTCDSTATNQVMIAINDALILSNSAIAALTKPNSNPASYFFPSGFASQATEVFQTINMALAPDSSKAYTGLNPIFLYCQDLLGKCGDGVWGYVPDDYNPATGMGDQNHPAEIVVCPTMLALPRNPPSCTGRPGQATIGWAFLRTFVQLRSVQPHYAKLAARGIGDNSPGLAASHALAKQKGGGYDQNADNFAELATWSYDLGVTNDGVKCPQDCDQMGSDASC